MPKSGDDVVEDTRWLALSWVFRKSSITRHKGFSCYFPLPLHVNNFSIPLKRVSMSLIITVLCSNFLFIISILFKIPVRKYALVPCQTEIKVLLRYAVFGRLRASAYSFLSFNAARIFSGVMGRLLILTPMAS